MDRVVDATTGHVVSVYKQHRRLQRIFRKQTTTRRKSKMNNDHLPNLTGPYLSTGAEVDQSEHIILITITADVHERSLVANFKIIVD
jgi:hypothetical protein